MKSFLFLVLSVALLVACERRPPIHRANLKLVVSQSASMPAGGDEQFAAEQINVILGPILLRRVEQRLHKTAAEIQTNLANLKITPVAGGEILIVTAESPTGEFAKDFANALADEYLKFRDEERARQQEDMVEKSAPGLLREIRELGQELKAIKEKLAVVDSKQNGSTNAQSQELVGIRKDYEQVRSRYNDDLVKLRKLDEDTQRALQLRNVSVLEYAILEPSPVRWFAR